MRGEPISQLSLCNQQITGTVSISLDLGKQARGLCKKIVSILEPQLN